ncbi:MAG: 30S ribosomal protein S6 [Planctomycetes bacterium]|nr:30S ribosomal protein S6 [Planctomycetota bacterium]
MDTVVKRLYEALFLVDSGQAAADWDGVTGAIKKVLDRAEAEVVEMNKWDERKLAYDVNKKSRGTYILVYFNCDTSKITGIERDVQLSENIVRVLVLRTDDMSKEDIERDTPLAAATRREEAAAKAAEASVAAKAEAVAAKAAEAEAKAKAAEAAATEALAEEPVTEAESPEASAEEAPEAVEDEQA